MKDFNYFRCILSLIEGALMTWAGIRILGFRLCDALVAAGAITFVWSFTFIHTMLGQNAAVSGSVFDRYEKVLPDMRYNIREESGYIKETLIVSILEFILGFIILFIK